MNVLALNSGSSSLKFGLYRVDGSRTEALLSEALPDPGQRDAMTHIERLLNQSGMPAPDAVGHRIVHGGPKLRQHCRIDDSILQQLDAATAFAPHARGAVTRPLRTGAFLRAATGRLFRHCLSR